MQLPKNSVWISTAILIGVLQGALAPAANAQPPTLTRELDTPMRGDRYAERISINFPFNGTQVTRLLTPVVPAGKKLFLQSVSIFTALTDGMSPYEAVLSFFQSERQPPFAVLYVDMDFQTALRPPVQIWARQRYFVGNRDINMVVNAGESISFHFSRNGNQGEAGMNFSLITLTGYFVDVDPLTPPTP